MSLRTLEADEEQSLHYWVGGISQAPRETEFAVFYRKVGKRLLDLGLTLTAPALLWPLLPTVAWQVRRRLGSRELWNVLRGEMSLVGPRPRLIHYRDRYTPEQSRRHEAPPGARRDRRARLAGQVQVGEGCNPGIVGAGVAVGVPARVIKKRGKESNE